MKCIYCNRVNAWYYSTPLTYTLGFLPFIPLLPALQEGPGGGTCFVCCLSAGASANPGRRTPTFL
jgi:hypothetical protein